MQAVRVHETGAAEVLRYEDVDDPKPCVGEALVKIAAAGVNYLDIYYRSGFHWGGHHKRPLPYVPGAEAAGICVEVGPGATDIRVGDRVAYGISNGYGSYAELCAIPSWHLFQLPSSVTFETAAATMLQGMTAHYLTHSTVAVKREDTVLVHAAAGGTGLMLVQIAKMRGARVFGTVSSADKARLVLQAGADAAINYVEQDFAAEVRKLTDGAGVNVVYDSVGQATFEKSLDVLSPLGSLVIFGQSSGPVPPFDTAVLNARGSLSLMRPSLTHHVTNHADVVRRAGDLFDWITAGRVKITIGNSFPLSAAAQAHRALESRQNVGKILLIP